MDMSVQHSKEINRVHYFMQMFCLDSQENSNGSWGLQANLLK
jgi:hypothetical protein